MLRHEQAGGGGYGDPFERAPAAVLEDVLDGKISAGFARAQFGVAVADGALDLTETAALRRVPVA